MGKQSAKVKVHAVGACYASPESQAEPRAAAVAVARGGRAIKRGFAPINRRCELRVALAILTHMLSNLSNLLFLFLSFFFCGSQIKNVNKQAAGTSWLGGGVG